MYVLDTFLTITTVPPFLSKRPVIIPVNIRAAERLAVKEQLVREAQDQVLKATTTSHTYPNIYLHIRTVAHIQNLILILSYPLMITHLPSFTPLCLPSHILF